MVAAPGRRSQRLCYQPDEPGDRYYWDEQRPDGPPAIALLYANAAQHVADHTRWIATLVGSAGA